MFRRNVMRAVVVAAVIAAAIQLVPYGRDHVNPPSLAEPMWDSSTTRTLAQRACYDCHSNETVWPAYASVAPVSWLVQHDVNEGREKLNFSEWGRPQDEAREAAETVGKGEMPPSTYTWMHPEARLTASERSQLIQGLTRTIGRVP